MNAKQSSAASRRDFIKGTAAVGGALAAASFMGRAYAAGGDTIRVGWIGCGGRGTGAASQALLADKNIKLVAVGDTFKDRLDEHLAALKDDMEKKAAKAKDSFDPKSKFDCPPERQFVGFDAYKKVIDAGVDVVVLTTPPHFRPEHLKYAVAQGKHVFAEKPVAVDGPGIRSVAETCAEARKKKLSIVSGLCWRYDTEGTGALAKHLHDGGVGQIQAVHSSYLTGGLWHFPRKESWSDMEYQMRNWLYFTWLSGDHIVEQNVHNLDRVAWYLGEYPSKCYSLGGRQSRTEPEFGHIFDHFATCFEFPSGAKCFNYCRQQPGSDPQNGDWIYGTKGTAIWNWGKAEVKGERPAAFNGNLNNAYQYEHDVLMASIRKGEPVDNSEYMINSTMMGIFGRMAAYSGKILTWKQAMESQEDLSPKAYDMSAKLDFPAVAKPGLTKFS
ncbi:MAG TPA: Gfo/Idh/MocA family oxidoreductase [Planctomycetota bacterium]|nr:Gfo/Idh/MocA family oxidoreductase [Planctomycetota bacterium]